MIASACAAVPVASITPLVIAITGLVGAVGGIVGLVLHARKPHE
jgi:hypothetical protein